jgi:hypothetical protein
LWCFVCCFGIYWSNVSVKLFIIITRHVIETVKIVLCKMQYNLLQVYFPFWFYYWLCYCYY